MELTDGTVTLQPPTEGDADRVAENVQASLPELSSFMPWATADYDRDQALAWINRDDERAFVIIADSDIVGTCGLNRFDDDNKVANLGYWVRTDVTGQGHATRAARLLARYGIVELGLARVEIFMSVDNAASRRVAVKAGAHFEGTMRRRLLLHDRHHDAHLFSITRGDLASSGDPPVPIDDWYVPRDSG